MTPDEFISKSECELRCGTYKMELRAILEELKRIDSEVVSVSRWQGEHDGRINAWWEQQFRTNNDHELRLRMLERKVIWISGLMAGLGSIGGSIITKLLGG